MRRKYIEKDNEAMKTDSHIQQLSHYLNILQDLMFKMFFSGDKGVLLSLLKTFLPIPEDTQVLDILNTDSSIYPSAEDKKQIVLDLRLQLNTGENINVEMQSISKNDFLPRILFYWAKLYTGDLERGQNYEKLSPAYSLIFTEFEVIKSREDFVTSFSIRSDTPPHFNFNNHLNIIFIELDKFKKETLKDLFDLKDYWCYFIKRSGQMNPSELQVLSQANEEMKMATDHLKTLSKDKQVRLHEELREKYLRDRRAEEAFSKKVGREEGIKEGKKEGIKEGKKEGKKEVIVEMLQKGFDVSVIQEISGFSQEEIQEIQQKKSPKKLSEKS